MSEVTTIAQAKEASLEKWNKILKEIKQLRWKSIESCGFCDYTIFKDKDKKQYCYECVVYDDCYKLVDVNICGAFNKLVIEIETVISFIEVFKEES